MGFGAGSINVTARSFVNKAIEKQYICFVFQTIKVEF